MEAYEVGCRQMKRDTARIRAFAAARGINEDDALALVLRGVFLAGKAQGVDSILEMAADEAVAVD